MHRLIDLPKISGSDIGDLTFIEGRYHIPFEIKRVYYIYNIRKGERRGRHAYRSIQSLFLALNGSFDVTLDDGFNRAKIGLTNPHIGLYVPAMTWKELDNFSPGAVCLVLVSDHYREDDYIRDYSTFVKEATSLRK
jgi:hypothetical protein